MKGYIHRLHGACEPITRFRCGSISIHDLFTVVEIICHTNLLNVKYITRALDKDRSSPMFLESNNRSHLPPTCASNFAPSSSFVEIYRGWHPFYSATSMACVKWRWTEMLLNVAACVNSEKPLCCLKYDHSNFPVARTTSYQP